MTLEQLKLEWQLYSQKLAVSQRLNEQLIISMLKERSRSRVSRIRNENWLLVIFMVIELAFVVAIIIGNPFDFKYALQFAPYGILGVGIILAIGTLIKSLVLFSDSLNKVSLDAFLKKTINEYEKAEKMQGWFGFFMLGGAISSTLSFLPKKLGHTNVWNAIAETAIIMIATLLLYYIAFRLGAFKNRKKKAFENDLKELNELKSISGQLADN